MNVKTRKAEQSEITRGKLIAVATELFTNPGYAETTTNELVIRAGVTRGALYHHFREKRDIFEAVYEEVHRGLAGRLLSVAVRQKSALDRLKIGSQKYLDAALEPTIQRIILIDAPSVLGLQRWRELSAKYGLALFRRGLQEAIDEGIIEDQPVEPLAHVLMGAIHEAALVIATASRQRQTRTEIGAAIQRLIDGLLISQKR